MAIKRGFSTCFNTDENNKDPDQEKAKRQDF
jgi:hypothetical protein